MTQKQLLWNRMSRLQPWINRRDRLTEAQSSRISHGRSLFIYLLLFFGVSSTTSMPALAQLRPDDTLGDERSRVSPDIEIRGVPSNQIDGGARRGENLFHSFRDFNVENGRGIYFSNPRGVTNILTRVTGRDSSDIHGILGVLGNANLFLLNPNGVLFGSNARLDIQGSFFTSTTDSILFDNDFAFSATDPQAPPLLRMNVPIGLQYGRNPGIIQVQRGAILELFDGQTLMLAGGAVSIDGAGLFASRGRVELVGVEEPGEVRLTQQGQEQVLIVPDELARANIFIGNGAIINGGDIAVTAQNLTITGNGRVIAGPEPALGINDAQAGDIRINTTEATNLDASVISHTIDDRSHTSGIRINTGSLSLTNGAQINVSTSGQGNAGSIIITARNAVSLDGESIRIFPEIIESSPTGIFSSQESRGATGQAGDIRITTGSLSLTNGAQIVASPLLGQGNAGSIIVVAKDMVSIDGERIVESPSGILSQIPPGATGQAGDIRITTGSLSLTNEAQIDASMFGQGNAGNIIITARNAVSLDGESSGQNRSNSSISSRVARSAIGEAGDIRITTGSLFLTNGAQIEANMLGQGNAGNISVTAENTISFDGENSGFRSGISSQVTSGATGQAGNIRIITDSLSLTNGARIDARIFGQGDAGNINITARDAVSFDGESTLGFNSGISSLVGRSAIGEAGDIRITTSSLSLTNGAQIDARMRGQGNAGNIDVSARDAVFLNGESSRGLNSGISSEVGFEASGKGGRVIVNTELLSIVNEGTLSTSSRGQGRAGDLEINARQLQMNNGSILTETNSGQGGNLALQVPDLLLLRNRSQISTSAGNALTEGDGGNITFNGNFIVAVPRENSDISANAFTGQGGNVEINAQGVFGIEARPQLTPLSDITASSEQGVDGLITINAPDVDPNRGLVQLPVDVVDASQLVAQTCPTGDTATQSNEFVVTGRGGLPPTPEEAVNQDAVQVDLVTTTAEEEPTISPSTPDQSHSVSSLEMPIVEADSWQVAADGQVVLAAAPHQDAATPTPNRPIYCP